MANRNAALLHRTNENIALIRGLCSQIDTTISKIRVTLSLGHEDALQVLLADLNEDYRAMDRAIAEDAK